MSFFSRSKSTPQSEFETTEMTPIADLDSFMTLMDGRNSLSQILPEEDNNGDNSSQSSQSTVSMHGVKYNYNEEDEEDEEFQNRFLGDEAEQSLVNDLESGGGGGLMKKVNIYKRGD